MHGGDESIHSGGNTTSVGPFSASGCGLSSFTANDVHKKWHHLEVHYLTNDSIARITARQGGCSDDSEPYSIYPLGTWPNYLIACLPDSSPFRCCPTVIGKITQFFDAKHHEHWNWTTCA